MKQVIIIFMVLFLSTTSLFAADMCNLKGIPFGITMEEFADQVQNKKIALFYNTFKNEYFNEEYDFGGKTATLTIKTDRNNIFYGFTIDFEKYAANRIDDALFNNLTFATRTLEKKYGKASTTFTLKRGEVLFKEQLHIIKKWNTNKCSAHIGIDHYESEYNAVVIVYDNALHKAEVARNVQKRTDDINKAVTDL